MRRDVRHAVVEADDRVPVAPLESCPGPAGSASAGQIGVVGEDHAALAGGDDLVAEKAEDARVAEGADDAGRGTRRRGLGGVLDHPEAAPAGDSMIGSMSAGCP